MKTTVERIEIPVEQFLYACYAMPVALIRRLYPILGKEKTLKLVKEVVLETTLKENNQPVQSFKEFVNRGASELVRKTTRREVLDLKKNKMNFKITKCLWSEVFKNMDASEIGEILVCETDFPRTRAWNPKLHLTRTQTIMSGASYCDFCYSWKE